MAVAGVPDPEWGQEVVAWVVPADPVSPPSLGELRSVVAERLAPFAAPRRVVLVESLPRSAIGKVRKDLLSVPGAGSVPMRHTPSTPDTRPSIDDLAEDLERSRLNVYG